MEILPQKIESHGHGVQGLIMSNKSLVKVDYWLTGPSFLSTPEQWPVDIKLQNAVINEADLELRPDLVTKQIDTNSVVQLYCTSYFNQPT